MPVVGAVLAATLSWAVVPSSSAPASTVPAAAFNELTYGNHTIWNWDFDSDDAVRTNVDFPTDLLFYGDASEALVQNLAVAFGYGGKCSDLGYTFCSTENFSYANDGVWHWVTDGGKKNGLAFCTGSTRHFRDYGGDGTSFYGPSLGYFVIGTTHEDHNEPNGVPGCPATYYDDPEGTEEAATNSVVEAFATNGYLAFVDYGDGHNAFTGSSGNHDYNSDGYTSYIDIP